MLLRTFDAVVAAGVEFQLEGEEAKALTDADYFDGPIDKKTGKPAGTGKGKCVALQWRWEGAVTNNFGHMHLAVRLPPRKKAGAYVHDLAMTHIITL